MHKLGKNSLIWGVTAISLLTLVGCSANSGMHPYQKTNHLRTQNPGQSTGQYVGQMRAQNQQRLRPSKVNASRYGRQNNQMDLIQAPGPNDMFQRWVDYEPQYKLFPGDQIDMVVQSAPELSRTLTIAPDGRISIPMGGTIMAAGRTIPWLEGAIRAELAKQLVDPTTAITNRSFAAQNIYVGGQVAQQGTYALSGPIGSLEAIIMAGGFLSSAKTREVAILRRAPNGGLMMRVIDHKRGLNNVRSYADNMQLARRYNFCTPH